MTMQNTQVHATAIDEHWLYRVGGLSAIALAVAYIITMPLYFSAGATPQGGEAWLTYLNGRTTVWWAILGLSILTDFLFLPVMLALYFALKGINRDLLLIGIGFVALFAFLDLAVTWPNYAALINLSSGFASATNDVQRTSFIAAATYANAVLPYSLSVYSIIVISFGILLIALVMLRGVFSKVTAYVGLATGLLGTVATIAAFFVPALGAAVIVTSMLTILWLLLSGYRLYRLGQA